MKWILMLFSIITIKTCDNSNTQKANSMLNDTYDIVALSGKDVSEFELTIAFADSTKKVSGFSGCNRFFGSYTIENNTIKFGPLASTQKMCPPKFMNIESDLTEALGKSNTFLKARDTLKLYEQDTVLIEAKKQGASPSVLFEYLQHSRNSFQHIKINRKSVSVQNKREGDLTGIVCTKEQWQKIMEASENVKFENMPLLEAPSQKRFFDGAAIAKLKVTFDGKTYETPSFDHGNPHPDIANLVKEILSIAQNVE
ncbi:META domain-containing protein [Seonamhaeicola sp.]|uniref:META domain-containing protein n=1 Tax=Seonamhaeicola sp. TaxID=1912245 RepID=UPI00261CDBA7|nr:META domain-containing protein [Seonamhaeicola sp.]